MSKKSAICFLILVFLLNSSAICSQNIQQEKQSLISILNTLKNRFSVSFSYADKTIENVEAIIPNSNLSLNEALQFLNEQTSLNFKLLDDNSVIINTKNNSNLFKLQKLNEVLISNYLTSGIVKNNDETIQIIPEKFGILPGLIEPDVLHTIQALPGINSVEEKISNINIRGGTNDQNQILWENIKMYQSGHFFGLISAFNPYLTKQINITKNGTSAQFGNGISSTINILQSNELGNTFKAGLGVNMINVDGFAKIPITKKTELQLSSRRSISDFLTTPTFNNYFDRIFNDTDLINNGENLSVTKNERFYFYDVSAKFLYDITKNDKLRVNFLTIFNEIDYEESLQTTAIPDTLNTKLSQQNIASGLEYTKNWNSNLKSVMLLTYSNYDLDATNNDVINNQRLIQENEVYDLGAKFNINYKNDDTKNFNLGYQFSEIGISNLEDVNIPRFRRRIKEVIRTHSAYGESEFISKNYNTHLKFGVRANYIEKFKEWYVEPRLSLTQRFLNNFKFELFGEFKSQTTTQVIDLQNDFLGVEKRRWVLANNATIPVVKSKQASIGLSYNKNKLLVSTEAYIKQVDGITTRSQGFQNQYQFINAIGNYQVKGIDFLINKQFSHFSTWLSYSYSTNNYTFNDLNEGNAFPNNLDLKHTFTLAGTYTKNNLKLAIGLNYNSGKPFTKPEANNEIVDEEINYNKPNSSNLDDYFRADFSTTYSFKFSKNTRATIGASLWNILDRKNIVNTYYTINKSNEISKIENKSLGITPNLSFRLHF